MEDKLQDLLDQLTIEETERLLAAEMKMEIDELAAARIKRSVYAKSGLRAGRESETIDAAKAVRSSRRRSRRALTAVAAALILCLLAVSMVGLENVSAAIRQMFGLAPGYGIVEVERTPILYVVDGQPTVANEAAEIKLLSGVAAADSVTIMFQFLYKDMDEAELLRMREEEWIQLMETDRQTQKNLVLYKDGEAFTEFDSGMGGGTMEEHWIVTFRLPEDVVNTDGTYTFYYGDYGLALDFQLAPYDVYDSVEEIGPTQVHNDISVTAVARPQESGQAVELYYINESPYQLWSFMADYQPYQGEDLHLQAGAERIAYDPLGGHGDAHSSFFFTLTPEQLAGPLTLNIPYLQVKTQDSAIAKLPVPAFGERQELGLALDFADGTLYIDAVEHLADEYGYNQYGDLRIHFHFENVRDNLIFKNLNIHRISWNGRRDGGGGSWEVDDDGVMQYYDLSLEAKDGKHIRLEFGSLEYYLTDGYTLVLQP